MVARAVGWLVDFEGSSRPVALLRIGLALVIWSRFARAMASFSITEPAQLILSVLFFAATSLMLVGLYTRIAVPATALALAAIYFVLGVGGFHPAWYAHHIYLLMIATALLAFTPCERSYSLDRWLAMRRAAATGTPVPEERGRLWAQRLIVLQMAALYFWAAYDKTGWHFLSGERLETILMWAQTGRPVAGLVLSPAFLVTAAILVVVVEYFLAVGILVRRWLPVAVPVGLALHASFYLLLPVSTYSITMMLLYLAVLDPDAVHRTIDRMQGYAPAPHRL